MKKIIALVACLAASLLVFSCAEEPVIYLLSYEAVADPHVNMDINFTTPKMDIPMHTVASRLLQDCGPVKSGYECSISATSVKPLPYMMDEPAITLKIKLNEKTVMETTAVGGASITYTVE